MSGTAPKLFSELTIRGVTLRNRIAVSPMCQYSSVDGAATDWHLVHLGARAAGGAAVVMVEATAVEHRGMISPQDMGIWDDKHIEPLARIARFVKSQGAVPAIQLAHAGRKASTRRPWEPGERVLTEKEGGWPVVGPSAIPFDNGYPTPHELTESEIQEITGKFKQATERALLAGFEIIEIHSAHGYLLHSFLSPLSNHRTDNYGGVLEKRMRLPLQVVSAARSTMPATMPLFMRISATDYVPGGWDLDQSVVLSSRAAELGVDLMDCSSGALVPYAKIPAHAGYQVPFAERIRAEAKVKTGAVGLITEAAQAEEIIAQGKADLVFLARQMLRDPYWPLHAAKTLGVKVNWPNQYARAAE